MFNLDFILNWSGKYPQSYDDEHYYPYLLKARAGDINSLRKITEWKNVGGKTNNPYPMKFSPQKTKCFEYFTAEIELYLSENGSNNLKKAFKKRAPVWSIFWHHILFNTPIFDVYTNIAFQYDTTGVLLSKKQAKITAPSHWKLYESYCEWLNKLLLNLRAQNNSITERQIDRALVCWASEQKDATPHKTQCHQSNSY